MYCIRNSILVFGLRISVIGKRSVVNSKSLVRTVGGELADRVLSRFITSICWFIGRAVKKSLVHGHQLARRAHDLSILWTKDVD